MSRLPIRLRVTAALALAMALVLAASGWFLYARLDSHLATALDAALQVRAQDLDDARPPAERLACGGKRRTVHRAGRELRPAPGSGRRRAGCDEAARLSVAPRPDRAQGGRKRADLRKSVFHPGPERALAAACEPRRAGRPQARAGRRRHAGERRRNARRLPGRATHRRPDRPNPGLACRVLSRRVSASSGRVHAQPCRRDLGRNAGRAPAGPRHSRRDRAARADPQRDARAARRRPSARARLRRRCRATSSGRRSRCSGRSSSSRCGTAARPRSSARRCAGRSRRSTA